MGKRRGRGEGSIEQLPSGSYRAVVSLGEANGKRRRLTCTRRTLAKARAWLHQRLVEQGRGDLVDTGLTLADWIDRWLEQKREHVQPRTFLNYAADCEKRIVPLIGHFQLAKLRQPQILDWYVAMSKAGHSAVACVKAGRTLSWALADAVRQGMLANNPATHVKPPRTEKRAPSVWTREQVATFREAIRGHRLEALFVLALDTGMRQGELLALAWPEVDLINGTIRVIYSLEVGTQRRKEVKTQQSRRLIVLSDSGREAIRLHRQKSAASGPVFTGDRSEPLKAYDAWYIFRCISKAAGLPLIRFHDLRHTHATLALAAGANLRAISARLGHTNPAFTLSVYAHALPEHDQKIADFWGGLLASRAGALDRPTSATHSA